VGLGITGVIKDEQMTGSYYVLPKNGFQKARLRGSQSWKASSSDLSPWLQVKLNDVAKIRRIALQGCTNRWSEEIRLLFSMDEIYWTTYKEHFTEKVTIHEWLLQWTFLLFRRIIDFTAGKNIINLIKL
jgi:hypothetical protein